MGMPRYKIILEYDGAGFVGWQRQENGLSVQQVLEEAIERFCGQTATTFAAGRTDSGVHALGQVVHFDLERAHPPDTVRDALNFHLKPAAAAVLTAETVGEEFHARLSARQRAYRYRIVNRAAPPTLERGRAWWLPAALDADAMAEAARLLVGRHDFTTFRASGCQAKSPIKTLDTLEVERADDEIRIKARARSFLHHQVRNFVGTLERVGAGKWTADDVRAALEARDRAAGGPTAPACGLYLVEVVY
jgi:tRNA pseudouridine38-40 synthase